MQLKLEKFESQLSCLQIFLKTVSHQKYFRDESNCDKKCPIGRKRKERQGYKAL